MIEKRCYNLLVKNKKLLTKQQYKTLKGQIKSQDYYGFLKGLRKLINKNTTV